MGQNEGKPWPLGLQERAAQLLGRRLTRIFTRRREGAGGRRAEGAGPQMDKRWGWDVVAAR